MCGWRGLIYETWGTYSTYKKQLLILLLYTVPPPFNKFYAFMHGLSSINLYTATGTGIYTNTALRECRDVVYTDDYETLYLVGTRGTIFHKVLCFYVPSSQGPC